MAFFLERPSEMGISAGWYGSNSYDDAAVVLPWTVMYDSKGSLPAPIRFIKKLFGKKDAPLEPYEARITNGFKDWNKFAIVFNPTKYSLPVKAPNADQACDLETDKKLERAYAAIFDCFKGTKADALHVPLFPKAGPPSTDDYRLACRCLKKLIDDEGSNLTVYLLIVDDSIIPRSDAVAEYAENILGYPLTQEDDYGHVHFSISVSEEAKHEIAERLERATKSFRDKLFSLIDKKGLTDVEVYKGANMDRRLFSKIRNDKNYLPKSETVISLAIAMHLDLKETLDLMNAGGYTLRDNDKGDIIAKYFIEKGIYDIDAINEVLFSYNLPLLGGQ